MLVCFGIFALKPFGYEAKSTKCALTTQFSAHVSLLFPVLHIVSFVAWKSPYCLCLLIDLVFRMLSISFAPFSFRKIKRCYMGPGFTSNTIFWSSILNGPHFFVISHCQCRHAGSVNILIRFNTFLMRFKSMANITIHQK